jgi:hypothetical protein
MLFPFSTSNKCRESPRPGKRAVRTQGTRSYEAIVTYVCVLKSVLADAARHGTARRVAIFCVAWMYATCVERSASTYLSPLSVGKCAQVREVKSSNLALYTT